MKASKFKLGDRVRKTKGSAWRGPVVGFYSTALNPDGVAVESEAHPGSVQIYPVGALELVPDAVRSVAAQPVYIRADDLEKARIAPHLCRVEPAMCEGGFVPLYTAPSAAARVPLSRRKIEDIMTEHYPLESLLRENVDAFEACVRDIEATSQDGGAA